MSHPQRGRTPPPLLLSEQADPHAALMQSIASLAKCVLAHHGGELPMVQMFVTLTPLEAAAVVLVSAVIEGCTPEGEESWLTACAVLAPYIGAGVVADEDAGSDG